MITKDPFITNQFPGFIEVDWELAESTTFDILTAETEDAEFEIISSKLHNHDA